MTQLIAVHVADLDPMALFCEWDGPLYRAVIFDTGFGEPPTELKGHRVRWVEFTIKTPEGVEVL